MAHISGHSGPTAYSEWKIGSTDSGFQYYTGYSLSAGNNYVFTVVNGANNTWQYYVDNQSAPFASSPTMPFNNGYSVANSERHNSCDSLWTHMYSLNYFSRSGSWSSSYDDLVCWSNDSTPGPNPYYLYKNSNSELHVYTSSSGTLC